MFDPVDHPKHYTAHPSGVDCIQITEHMGFNLGNALKYIWRCDLKHDAVQDLEKAAWYIHREIEKRMAANRRAAALEVTPEEEEARQAKANIELVEPEEWDAVDFGGQIEKHISDMQTIGEHLKGQFLK